ncbi:MAG TPA: VCBS repeat-containing protein, partial [Gaiellaceae bacterium]|nr:VCBS repeat-containing protein [Gaiellaceae bacterium]
MTRSAAAAALLAGLSLTLAGSTHAKTTASAACVPAGGTSSVKRPQFVRNIPTGETGWFASPSLVDLNGDGKLEIVAP